MSDKPSYYREYEIPGLRRVLVTLDPETIETLDKIAAAHHESRSAALRRVVWAVNSGPAAVRKVANSIRI